MIVGGLVSSVPAIADDAQAPEGEYTIAQIQGEGSSSPLAGQKVTTSGVVTAVQTGRNGLIIQMKTADVPADFTGSSALFVQLSTDLSSYAVGDELSVAGEVQEIGNVTTLIATNGTVERTGQDLLDQVDIPTLAAPKATEDAESRESMVFNPAGTYRVVGNPNLVYTGQLSLTDGDRPHLQPTQAGLPGSPEAVEQAAYNEAHHVILDDANAARFDVQYPDTSEPAPPAELPYLALGRPGPTLGATVTFKSPAVVTSVNGRTVIEPTFTVPSAQEFVEFSEVREHAPADVGGNFKLATFNVLNYFSDLGVYDETVGADGNRICQPTLNLWDKSVPVAGNWDCPRRGAWDEAGLKRQEAKIVNAINSLGGQGAQVVALQEIENDWLFQEDIDASLKSLVTALNEADPSQGWGYVPSPPTGKGQPVYGGEDKIRQAFIYKPAAIELVGDAKYLDDEAYQSAADARAPLAQVFKHRDSGQNVLVINNHLTYKGGTVVGDDNKNPGDEKGLAWDTGRNNGDRTRQAKALVAFAEQESAASDAAVTLLVGDFNAYSYEDPIQEMVAAGYADLMDVNKFPSSHSATDWNEYTYSYNSMFGNLDHVMVSDSGMQYLTGNDTWTANAYESNALEYSRFMHTGTNYHSDDVFRASDHNAAIVGFELPKVTEPTAQPSNEPSSQASPSSSSKPAVSATPSVKAENAGKRGLPKTGANVLLFVVIAAGLILGGAGLRRVRAA
ncbi:hypothetical protein DDD63_03510 [Actinobaculum sp. 313]|nr:hypothetical protein DDD63_03510 [Actinobaculum sp. 313]